MAAKKKSKAAVATASFRWARQDLEGAKSWVMSLPLAPTVLTWLATCILVAGAWIGL